MSETQSFQDQAKAAFDTTLSSVEDVHQTIAEWPFNLADRVGLFPEAAAEGKRVASETIASVYDVIRDVNAKVTDYSKSMLNQA